MGALMVVLVFPTPQFGGELPGRAEDRSPVKLLSIRAVAALDFAVDLGAARRDAPMRDAEIPEPAADVDPPGHLLGGDGAGPGARVARPRVAGIERYGGIQ